jgi:hypothetical protein
MIERRGRINSDNGPQLGNQVPHLRFRQQLQTEDRVERNYENQVPNLNLRMMQALGATESPV